MTIKIFAFLAMIPLITTIGWGQDVVHEAFPERVPGPVQNLPMPAPLSLNLAGAFLEGSNLHQLAPVSDEEITAADQEAQERYAEINPGPLRVGLVRSVGTAPLSIENGSAQSVPLSGGGNLWTMAIQSPDALGLRLHFSNFDVGGGQVLVYARKGSDVVVRGPYTGRGPDQNGEFWTESLPGDTAFIEVSGSVAPRLAMDEIIHFDQDTAGSDRMAKGPGSEIEGAIAALLPCHLNVMCYGNPPVNPVARDATVRINFVEGSSAYACSGTLLNDLDPETTVPYFLTARHCLSTQPVVNTLEVVYFWQAIYCDPPFLPDYYTLPRTRGGTLLDTNQSNDMTFIRLSGDLPAGAALAGWTNTEADNIVGISHPQGDFKRVDFAHTTGFDPIVGAACRLALGLDFYLLETERGMTEPGSSGSGAFNYAGQLEGQLYGFCGITSNPNCGNRGDWRDAYGKFSITYPRIRRWLEIGGTIHVNRAYVGPELGTPTQPFRTVNAANNFAWNGTRIKIQAGSYPEVVTFSKQLTLLANGGPVTIGGP